MVVPQQVHLFLRSGCGETQRGGLYGATALPGDINEDSLESAPGEPAWP